MGHNHSLPQKQTSSSNTEQLQPWEPRTKLVSGIIFVFGVISLNNIWLLVAALMFSVIFALGAGLLPGELLKKVLVIIPLLGLMSIPLIFGAGYPPEPERAILAALIILKALTAMTFTVFVFTNQPVEEMLEAMEHLRVPSTITTVMYLAYRYGFLFLQEMQTTQRALRSRLFAGRLSIDSLRIYGELAGGLFIKSINRSEAVYRAIASRGFQGSIPVNKPRQINRADIFKAVLAPGFIVVLFIIDKVVW